MKNIYNLNKRSYFYTKRKNNKVLIYPLTTKAKKEMNFAKENILTITQLLSQYEKKINKELELIFKKTISDLEDKNKYLIIDRNNLETIYNIAEYYFVSEKINNITNSTMPEEFQAYFKIFKHFVDSILKIKE